MNIIEDNYIKKNYCISMGIDIPYKEIYNVIKKEIIDFKIHDFANIILNDSFTKAEFYKYIIKNKNILKPLVWNKLVEIAKLKRGDIIECHIQVFYTRLFDYCNCLDDFMNTLYMTPELDLVFEYFLNMIFIRANDINTIFQETKKSLKDMENIFEEDEFKLILKNEFLENLKIIK